MGEPTAATVNEPKEVGVFYARNDHAGFMRRLLIDAIDVIVVLILIWIAATIAESMNLSRRTELHLAIAIWLIYFIIIKWSIRTAGYRLAGMKLVNLRGQRAGFWSVLLRSLFMAVGPINYLIDLLWMPSNSDRQALRDQILGTYVVREDAEPLGSGPIIWENCHLMGYNFVFPEVRGARPG